jgi:hypothetical protein
MPTPSTQRIRPYVGAGLVSLLLHLGVFVFMARNEDHARPRGPKASAKQDALEFEAVDIVTPSPLPRPLEPRLPESEGRPPSDSNRSETTPIESNGDVASASERDLGHSSPTAPSSKRPQRQREEPREIDLSEPVESKTSKTTKPASSLLSLSQARKHVEDAPYASTSAETPEASAILPLVGELGPQKLGPARAVDVQESDPGFAEGGETVQRLRRSLRDYNVVPLGHGELEVRPQGGEFVAIIRKDGVVEIEHAGAAQGRICLIGGVCLALGETRDAGQKKRTFLNRVRIKRNPGMIRNLGKSLKLFNESLAESLASGDVREIKMLPMLIPIVSGGFGYVGKRAISNAERTFLNRTEAARLAMMQKELTRSYASARGRIARELRELWANRQMSLEERASTLWSWYLEIDVSPPSTEISAAEREIAPLLEMRAKEARAAKLIVARFIVERAEHENHAFSREKIENARSFVASCDRQAEIKE